MIRVRPWQTGDLEACLEIVRGLPDHFTADVPDTVAGDLARHPAWIGHDDRVMGFAIVDRRSRSAASSRRWRPAAWRSSR